MARRNSEYIHKEQMVDVENESKPDAGNRHSYPLAVAFFQFCHLDGLFDPEVDLVAVLVHQLQLDVFGVISGHDEIFSW